MYKHGGIFKHEFVANLLLSRLVKKNFENRMLWPRVWCLVFLLTVYKIFQFLTGSAG